MTNKLPMYGYQERALMYGLQAIENRASGVYYAIDLGLGKTRICVEIFKRVSGPFIVIAPVQVAVSVWPEELEKWAFKGSYAVVHGRDKAYAVLSNPDVLVMPYSSIKWFCESFQRLRRLGLKWQKRLLVLDEISACKDPKTNRFKMLKQMDVLWKQTKFGLSATPRANAVVNLWSQYFLLDHGSSLGKTQKSFHDKYCEVFTFPGTVIRKYTLKEAMRQQLYDDIAHCTLRLDKQDHIDIPDIVYSNTLIDLPVGVKKQYDIFEQSFFIALSSGQVEAFNAASKVAKLRQIIQGGIYFWPEGADETDISLRQVEYLHFEKLKALRALIETRQGHNIICAVQFKFEVTLLQKEFPNAPIFAGGFGSPEERKQVIEEWNQGECPLLICHPASISHGLNLQVGGSLLVYLGLPWSLEQYSQLNGRLHRLGQTETVHIHHILAKDTVDTAVLKALERKDDEQRDLLDYLKEYFKSQH